MYLQRIERSWCSVYFFKNSDCRDQCCKIGWLIPDEFSISVLSRVSFFSHPGPESYFWSRLWIPILFHWNFQPLVVIFWNLVLGSEFTYPDVSNQSVITTKVDFSQQTRNKRNFKLWFLRAKYKVFARNWLTPLIGQ